jgi:MAX-like protein X
MELVPTCRNTSSGNKPSRAVILQRSIDYILYLYNHAAKHQQQIDELEKEVQALKIMKENYEQIARIQHPRMNAQLTSQQLPNYIKFHVFRSFSDELFQSFTPSINTSSFETLSSCIINWLEDHCKPQTLREMMIANLHKECTAANPLSSSSHPAGFHRTNN